MIIVTGATGTLAPQVIDRLLEHVDATEVGASVRDPGKAKDLAARGIRVRRGDFAHPETLASAFEGADQVFIVSSSSAGADAVAQHTAAIDTAFAAGAERVLYTSHQAAAHDSLFGPMPDHAGTTDHLVGIDRRFVALRHGFYTSTIPALIRGALQSGEIVAPADGPVSWTTHADLAEADARILLAGDSRYDGITPPLTAGQTADLSDVARVLSELTGRTIRRVVAEDEDWVAAMVGRGLPEGQVRFLLGMFLASRRGEFAVTDPALAEILGREPQSIRPTLEAVVAAG